MHKFFVQGKNITGNKITILDNAQLRHIQRVLRFKPGEKLLATDELGNDYACVIEDISSSKVVLAIQGKRPAKLAGAAKITIACAIPKKSKFDDIVDKLTQLGVTKIIPLKTERVVVKFDRNKESLRKNRWEKIGLCASQQSQRSDIVVIESLQTLEEVLGSSSGYDLKIIPTLEGERRSLSQVLAKNFLPMKILVLIGPEGDFSAQEVELAKKAGCIPVSLGKLVLRVETAAVAVVSYIMLNAYH